VTSPAAGSGDNASVETDPADDFVPARCGQGVRIDETDESVRVRQLSGDGSVQNIEFDQGTIDFWYSPFSPHDEDMDRILFTTLGVGSETIRLRKAANSNDNALLVVIDDGVTRTETAIAGTDYAWNPGDWVRITVAWDSTVATGSENCWIYLDGVAMPTNQFGFDMMLDMPDETSDDEIVIGLLPDMGAPSDLIADGIIDEFAIYDQVLDPS
jgi:hypothetical protein